MSATATAEQAPDLVNKALEAFKARDRDASADFLIQAVATDAPLGAGWAGVSRLAAMIGEVGPALTAAQRVADVNAADPAPRLALGQLLAHHGRVAEARDVGVAVTRDHPRSSSAWHFLGTCRAQLGETEQSIADLRHAMSLHNSPVAMAWSWHPIAEAKKFKSGDPDVASMEALLTQMPSTEEGEEARSVMLYALGKAYADLQRTDDAFAAYAEGSAIMKRRQRYEPAETDAFVDQVVSGWTDDFHASLPGSGVDSTRPIFVFGLPRSGTTLVEQILASHAGVTDGAEINLFSDAAMPIRGFSPAAVADYAGRAGADGFTAMGKAYLHLLDERFGLEGRVIDKTLNHSRYLGLISHVLPQARFIWLQRSPGAVAWSCFRTRFARGVDWSWSLDDMGRYFAGEDRLRAH
ncbi:MAG: tetratricopeptide repeat-containing sulfotransferase family protein, partial [Brevundimonas sp.]